MKHVKAAFQELSRTLTQKDLPGGALAKLETDAEWTGWVAIRIMAHTIHALTEYEEHGFGPTEQERWLRLYGFFQSIVLQQDALKEIYRHFLGTRLAFVPNSGCMELRRLRNLVGGHPVKHGRDRRDPITRIDVRGVSENGSSLIYLVWDPAERVAVGQHVDLHALFEKYKQEIVQTLSEIHAKAQTLPDGEEGYRPPIGAP